MYGFGVSGFQGWVDCTITETSVKGQTILETQNTSYYVNEWSSTLGQILHNCQISIASWWKFKYLKYKYFE